MSVNPQRLEKAYEQKNRIEMRLIAMQLKQAYLLDLQLTVPVTQASAAAG